jgi:thioester reductase-like protein
VTVAAVAILTPLQLRIAGVIAETLRIPVDVVAPNESFAALGMDSLAAIELTAAIEDELGVELPLTAVHEYPSLESLCAFIEGGATTTMIEAPNRARMLSDAVLPFDIAPSFTLSKQARLTRDARAVLVTGATGFVGAYLLRAIAMETDVAIYCLVRPSAATNNATRLREHLRRYEVWSESLDARIHIVEGDITRRGFGLASGAYARLVHDVDAVYHAAADVNWVSGYEALRDTNVLGTVEVLRFACAGMPKPLHFVSSVSVCHSTTSPRRVDEDLDPIIWAEGLWMGYAQTKCVAESLVRMAGARGLPVTILRPSLITGDRAHGRSNPDDLVSRFIAGCIQMRAAPDLDWRMDCVAVDDVATAIVRLSHCREAGIATSHITAVAPRHWRECVLWMRLAGYDIELVPYRDWMDILRATSGANGPLHTLRSFFLRTIPSEENLTLPELFEEPRRTQVSDARTRDLLTLLGHSSAPVTAKLLSRYFDDFERHEIVPRRKFRPVSRPVSPHAAGESCTSITSLLPTLTHSIGEWLGDDSIEIESVALHPVKTDDSIVAELTSWRGNAHDGTGLYHADIGIGGRRTVRRSVRLFVKSKRADTHVIEVAECVAALASPALGETVARFREHLGFTRSHAREVALYADADERLRRNTPRVIATRCDDSAQQWMVVLESIDDKILSSNNGDATAWSERAIDAAIAGLAQIHASGVERRDELAVAPWQAPRRDRRQRIAMLPLWSALATHAFEHASPWADRGLRRNHERLLNGLDTWATALDVGPLTLIHNDFNPRNVVIRGRGRTRSLCAFDWELSTMGLPQRDLAELLAFVLPEDAPRSTIARWIERHRALLERESGVALNRDEWDRGFRAAMCDLLVDRLASYAMVNRIRAQSFLPRVVRGWNNLFHHYRWVA